MKQTATGLIVCLFFLFVATTGSYAEPSGCVDKIVRGVHGEGMPMMGRMEHRGMGAMWPGHRVWRQLGQLGLDGKQEEAIRNIINRAGKDTIRKRADVQVARVELRDILHKDPVDIHAAEAKLKQIESLMTDIRLSHIKAMEEIKAQLTPEQREQFKKNSGKWRHRGGRRGSREMSSLFGGEKNRQPESEGMPY